MPLCFSLSQSPQFIFLASSVGFWKMPGSPLHKTYLYIVIRSTFWKVLCIFFNCLVCLQLLNFHGLHGLCVGHVGWVFSIACVGSVDIWSPHAVGVIDQALFFVCCVFFWRREWYLGSKLQCNALIGSYERADAALDSAGKLYHTFKKNCKHFVLYTPSRENITQKFIWFPLSYGA